ncbi:MAG: site-specific integrase [Eggerthellaceae bacterium]|nr:site-specific integrase [Eggerthellaceae bacterium]
MAYGEGTITQVKDKDGKPIKNKWKIEVYDGKDPITGRRLRRTRVVNGTKSQAQKIKRQMIQERENGLDIAAQKYTLTEFADMYTKDRLIKGGATERTIREERTRLRHVEEWLGNKQLKDITPAMINTVYANIQDTYNLSTSTLHHTHAALKRVLAQAVDYDIIPKNPCDKVKAPKLADTNRRSLTTEEYLEFYARLDEAEAEAYAELEQKEARQYDRKKAFDRDYLVGVAPLSTLIGIRVGIATGMRLGEVLALCWGCVDLDRKKLKVTQSLEASGRVKPPKSKAGIRTISLDDDAVKHLRNWKERQRVELAKIGITQTDQTPVVSDTLGSYFDHSNYCRRWRQYREQAGFPDLLFHELRHTQATQLLSNGVDVKTVQARLGHSNASITLNHYAHAIPENDEVAADILGQIRRQEPSDKGKIINLKSA